MQQPDPILAIIFASFTSMLISGEVWSHQAESWIIVKQSRVLGN
jgi:hypothetical protein